MILNAMSAAAPAVAAAAPVVVSNGARVGARLISFVVGSIELAGAGAALCFGWKTVEKAMK